MSKWHYSKCLKAANDVRFILAKEIKRRMTKNDHCKARTNTHALVHEEGGGNISQNQQDNYLDVSLYKQPKQLVQWSLLRVCLQLLDDRRGIEVKLEHVRAGNKFSDGTDCNAFDILEITAAQVL